MKKILHIVPYDGIGGVETAARSMNHHLSKTFSFDVEYIYTELVDQNPTKSTISPVQFLLAARKIYLMNPDLLVVSLWRSCLVGILVKVTKPNLKIITFLHLGKDVHFIDFILTRISISLSSQIWADSLATIHSRIGTKKSPKSKVISFVTNELSPSSSLNLTATFIYWGRLNEQKGLDRAIKIFAKLKAFKPNAHLLILGPDRGSLNELNALCQSLSICDSVEFVGAVSASQIPAYAAKASFYLQTSKYEGMAMSVVEAMQMGLVPVVTPVGEIKNYCIDSINSIIVENDDDAISRVVSCVETPSKYWQLRKNAIATWAEAPTYGESILEACLEISS